MNNWNTWLSKSQNLHTSCTRRKETSLTTLLTKFDQIVYDFISDHVVVVVVEYFLSCTLVQLQKHDMSYQLHAKRGKKGK